MAKAVDYARAAQGPGVRARAGHSSVLAFAVGRRGDVPPAGGARGRRGARSGHDTSRRGSSRRGTRPRRELGEDPQDGGRDVLAATDDALAQPQPGAEARSYVSSTRPTSIRPASSSTPRTIRSSRANETTMVDLLNACMRDEMRARRAHPRCSARTSPTCRASSTSARSRARAACSRSRGDCRRSSAATRVYNSPLAEANIVGPRDRAGACAASSPVVEIQFFDYIWPAYMQLRDELATMRWRSNSAFCAPVVVRTTYGGYIRGAIYHSQTGASLFTHCPGLRVVCPATALDANGLLRTAIRCDDPVIFLEHKHLYRQTYNKAPYPGPELHDPVRQGADGARGDGRDGRDLRRHGAARVRGGQSGRPSTGSRSRSSTCARCRRGTRRRCTRR